MLSRPSTLADYPGKGDVYSHSSGGQHLQSCTIAIASLQYTCTKVHSTQEHNPNIHLHTQDRHTTPSYICTLKTGTQPRHTCAHLRQVHSPVIHLHTQDRCTYMLRKFFETLHYEDPLWLQIIILRSSVATI